jgi:coproporphyrinogen III oxidase-like Fe-S oxidoreductase
VDQFPSILMTLIIKLWITTRASLLRKEQKQVDYKPDQISIYKVLLEHINILKSYTN